MAASRNLLILLASGLRSDALADERAWPLQTPNLTKLTDDGRGFRGVAASACPCEPGGMVSLLTGLHARQHGCVRPSMAAPLGNALPRWLAEAGYHVAGVGVVGPLRESLHESCIVESISVASPEHCEYFRHLRGRGLAEAVSRQRTQRARGGPFEVDRLLMDPGDDADGFITARAREMMARLPADRPWAMLAVFTGPGNDLPAPPLYSEVVNPALLTDGFAPADIKRLDDLAEPAYPRIMLQRLEPHALARIRADYLGRVAMIDHAAGALGKAAGARPDARRTWTVVASDGGYLLGEHGLVGRRSFLAGAMETPVVIAPPDGRLKPLACHDEGLLSTVDVAATIAALAGADLPPAATGRSILPALGGEAMTPLVGGILSEFNDRLMIETERYKAVFDAGPAAARACLGVFDLLADPDERRNLTEAAAGRQLVDALRCGVADVLLPLRA